MTAETSRSVSPAAAGAPSSPPSSPPISPDLPAGTVVMLAAEQLDGPLIRSMTKEFERRGVVHSVELREITVRPATPDRPGVHHDAGTGEVPAAGQADVGRSVRAVRWSVALQDSDDSYGTQLLNSLVDDAAIRLAELNGGPEQVTAAVLPAVQREQLLGSGKVMLVMDVDSTLIDQEVIDLLARHAGRERQVAEVTERAMRGELDFAASLHQRVAALQGLPADVLDATAEAATPTQGAEQLIESFHRRDWPTCAVSGGFRQVLEPLATDLGLTAHRANDLTLDRSGEGATLSGTVSGAVVDRVFKGEQLHRWAAENGLGAQNVVAVGDGANDLDMVAAAGVGVAFCPKPALAEQADVVIRHRSLELVGLALGFD